MVQLFAIAVEEARALTNPDEELTLQLREIAAEAFPPTTAQPRGRLDQLGPLLRTPPGATIIKDDAPSGSDLTRLLHGRPISPARLPACWRLIRVWLAELAWDSLTLSVAAVRLGELSDALTLAADQPQLRSPGPLNVEHALPVPPPPGVQVSWLAGQQIPALAAALKEPIRADPLAELPSWLAQFEQWSQVAELARRPPPDLLSMTQF